MLQRTHTKALRLTQHQRAQNSSNFPLWKGQKILTDDTRSDLHVFSETWDRIYHRTYRGNLLRDISESPNICFFNLTKERTAFNSPRKRMDSFIAHNNTMIIMVR